MTPRFSRLLVFCLLLFAVPPSITRGQKPEAPKAKQKTASKTDRREREKSLRAIAKRLSVGPGSVIADVGAGNGADSWVFADIVGPGGKVYAEDIDAGKVKGIEQEAAHRGLPQVKAVLGKPDDPLLPAGSLDMAFMHFVYHHLSQPREMLQGIWKALKPGGHLVIIDQRRGTLLDWVPREERAGKHFWTAETTVVREAREQGFLFAECAEQDWHAKEVFVLVFQRPAGWAAPDGDPDAPAAIAEHTAEQLLPAPGQTYRRVAFIALGEGRKLMAPILEATRCDAVDIVLEEWATQKDERPPLPPGVTMPSTWTERGDPKLGPQPLDAVFFLDSYHLLFHAPTLLAQLGQRLTASGCVYVLDRQASGEISHREASHRRKISPQTVQQEMSRAGFHLLREGTPRTDGRFLLVFGKAGQ